MAAEERTVRFCACDERIAAEYHRTFMLSRGFGGWVAFDVPTRSMSQLARYYAFVERGAEYPHEDHQTEPYVYHCCPWCGHDLPGVQEDSPPRPFGQADGSPEGPET